MQTVTSSQYAPMILDPLGAGNGPEIAYVTAHTSGASTATLVRGREGTTAVNHAQNTPWVIGPTVADHVLEVAARGSLPATGGLPYRGQMCWIMDEKALVAWDGTKWCDLLQENAPTSWTPIGGNSWTFSSATGFKEQRGRLWRVTADLIVSYAGTGGQLQITNLPATVGAVSAIGVGAGFHQGDGLTYPMRWYLPAGQGLMSAEYLTGDPAHAAAVHYLAPFGFGVGDSLHVEAEFFANAG